MGGCDALKARRLDKLMREDPHCWYCGREVRFRLPREGSVMAPEVAVIESELSRCETGTQPRGARKYLSCYECADHRARYECAIFKMWTDQFWAEWREANGYPKDRPTNKERKAETAAAKALDMSAHEEGFIFDGC
jgi:hypothetical protein